MFGKSPKQAENERGQKPTYVGGPEIRCDQATFAQYICSTFNVYKNFQGTMKLCSPEFSDLYTHFLARANLS